MDTSDFVSRARRHWTLDEIRAIYSLPVPELIHRAATIHRRHFDPLEVQRSTLLSVKTGGCPENCAYCPQSAHYREVHLDKVDMMETAAVVALAARAKTATAPRSTHCSGRRRRHSAAA